MNSKGRSNRKSNSSHNHPISQRRSKKKERKEARSNSISPAAPYCSVTRRSSGLLRSQNAPSPSHNQRPGLIPNFHNYGVCPWFTREFVDSGVGCRDCLPRERGLIITLTDEMGINNGGDDGSLEC